MKEGILKERYLTGGSECQVSSHLSDTRSSGQIVRLFGTVVDIITKLFL